MSQKKHNTPGINQNWKPSSAKTKKEPLAYYVDGIKNGDRSILSEAITLIENVAIDTSYSMKLLDEISKIPRAATLRIGISGSPGVGKSTFINSLGAYLIKQGKKVAVLAIDPSSEITKGSILGDKTRMHDLSVNPNAFVRPTPSSSKLGGLAPVTKESIILCEAAGYEIILVETVGVGQSEIKLKDIVDVFCLLLLPGAGDDLQGIKKGIVEISDLFVINKADGDRIALAKESQKFYRNALHLQKGDHSKWIKKVLVCSALESNGLNEVWESLQAFQEIAVAENRFNKKRKNQEKIWTKQKKHDILARSIEQKFQFQTSELPDDSSPYRSLIDFQNNIDEKLKRLD